jgi:hypothetical protein
MKINGEDKRNQEETKLNKRNHEKATLNKDNSMKMDSVVNENEKFFAELASAYASCDGERLKKDSLEASSLSTDNLDRKLRLRMKSSKMSSKTSSEKSKARRNRMVVLSTLAAGFLMFFIYTAVAPGLELFDSRREGEVLYFAAPEAEPAEMEVTDELVEAEEEPMMEDEDLAFVEDEGDFNLSAIEDGEVGVGADVEPGEIVAEEDTDYLGVLAARGYDFEDRLPEEYRITSIEFGQDENIILLSSATNQPIILTESPLSITREMANVMTTLGVARVDGIDVYQEALEEGDYRLYFQIMESSFTVVGEDMGELIAVARTVIWLPEFGHVYDGYEDITLEELMDKIPLPRGLVTLVPML